MILLHVCYLIPLLPVSSSTWDLVTREVDSPLCQLEAALKTLGPHPLLSARVSEELVTSLLMNTASG